MLTFEACSAAQPGHTLDSDSVLKQLNPTEKLKSATTTGDWIPDIIKS